MMRSLVGPVLIAPLVEFSLVVGKYLGIWLLGLVGRRGSA